MDMKIAPYGFEDKIKEERTLVIFKDKPIWLFLRINLSTAISMKRSRRELSSDVAVDRFIVKNNQITSFPCFTFIPKTGKGLPKLRVCFYSAHRKIRLSELRERCATQ